MLEEGIYSVLGLCASGNGGGAQRYEGLSVRQGQQAIKNALTSR